MTAKYTLTDETKTLPGGIVLHRIKRVSDGAIGGWIEKESNLSHADESWVYGDAQVSGNAQVYGDAWVYGDAQVYGNARVKFSRLTTNYHEDLHAALRCGLNAPVLNEAIRICKRVRRIDDNHFASKYDNEFIYTLGEVAEAVATDSNPAHSCSSGLHASTLDYWEAEKGTDTTLIVEIKLEDIVTVLEGKVRCRKLLVVGVVENAFVQEKV